MFLSKNCLYVSLCLCSYVQRLQIKEYSGNQQPSTLLYLSVHTWKKDLGDLTILLTVFFLLSQDLKPSVIF